MRIKGIITNRYEVSVYECPAGYYIQYQVGDIVRFSEVVKDYLTVSHLFDVKVQDLEGH